MCGAWHLRPAEGGRAYTRLYNAAMKSWDSIVIGGGIIGLSLALELRRHGAEVLVVERGEAGREASHAAAGMLAFCDPDTHPFLQDFCFASARLYPEYVKRIEAVSGL